MTTSRCVAVGIGTYADATAYPELPAAATDATTLAPLFAAGGLEAATLVDRTEAEINAELNRLLLSGPPGARGGTLVIYWAGHGEPRDGALRLIASDTLKNGGTLFTAGWLTDTAVRSGAAQILLIFDTCYSGAAASGVIQFAASGLGKLEDGVWLGMLASARAWQKAGDGCFGDQLRHLLQNGPDHRVARARWDEHNAGVTGDDLLYAVQADWDPKLGQSPAQSQYGTALAGIVVPNPLYQPSAPARLVEQLVDAARGGEAGDAWYFTGRHGVLSKLAGWIRSGQPGIKVLTGPPGCGKSAVLGQLLCLSDPIRRTELLAEQPLPADDPADPGQGSVHALLAARGLTVKQAVRELDEQLSDGGVIPADRRGQRGRGELLDALEASATTAVVVVDGLDEAGSEAWNMLELILRPASGSCLVIVGTREMSTGEGHAPLTAQLQPDPTQVISLLQEADDDADIRAYVHRRLDGADDRMDPDRVADLLIGSRSSPGEGLFLLARILTSRLRDHPIDTGADDWVQRLAGTVEEVFDLDLEAIAPLVRPDGDAVPGGAADLLRALAWSFGSGFPVDIWGAVAGAIAGVEFRTDDVYLVLDVAGRYVVVDGEGGRAVYRLAHQSLVLHLRASTPDAAPAAIAATVVERYRTTLAGRADRALGTYLVRYTWRHCVEADLAGLELLRTLGADYPDQVTADVGVAFRWFAEHRRRGDDVTVTLSAYLTAAQAYHAMAARDLSYSPDLARVLVGLSDAYAWAGRPEGLGAAQDAVDNFRVLAQNTGVYRSDYAASLMTLGRRYAEARQPQEALETTRQAEQLYAELAAENEAYKPELAGVRLNLSFAYSTVGNGQAAADAAMAAFIAYTELAQTSPGYRIEVGRTGMSVGARLAAIGQLQVAVAAAEGSVELLSRLTDEDPGLRVYLADALNSLANVYQAGGDPKAALDAAERAVSQYRELPDDYPEKRSRLARALSNLGNRLGDVGDADGALARGEEAVQLLRDDAAANPSHRLDLVQGLVNLSVRYHDRDPGRALQLAGEAIQVGAELPPSPTLRSIQASAFNNASTFLRQLGQPDGAADMAGTAADLYQGMMALGQTDVNKLVSALTNVTRAYAGTPNPERADARWAQAVAATDKVEDKIRLLSTEARYSRPERAVTAVADGEALAGQTVLALEVHQAARVAYQSDPGAFDSAWQARFGAATPAWVHIDPNVSQLVIAWLALPTLEEVKKYHAEHLDVLATDAAIAALEEAAPLLIDPAHLDEVMEQYRWAMREAPVSGLDSVYGPAPQEPPGPPSVPEA